MTRLLGTTAIAATLLILAAPAFGQGRSPYNTNPTPQERAQTNQLNTDADQDAQTPPVAPPSSDADYAAKKAQYDQQMRDYNARRETYDREHARYQAERAHHWYVLYGYDDRRPIARMSGDDLMDLRVRTQRGDAIGHVRSVDTDGSDRVVRVRVSTGGGNAVWLDADDLRFDPATRTVVTDLSRSEVDQIAHARF